MVLELICKTELNCDMTDIFFDNRSDFIGVIPFIDSTNGFGIGMQISPGININHEVAFRGSAGIFAEALLRNTTYRKPAFPNGAVNPVKNAVPKPISIPIL